jgi:hypothetical protein
MCAYNPGVQDRSGEYLAQGIGRLGDSIQQGMASYAQNKQMAALALGKFEGALSANPDILKFLNPDEPSPNAPSDAVKAFMKLQKDGTVGVRDAALLSTFADTYTKAKEDKQMADMRDMQMKQLAQQQARQQQDQAAEDQMNARFAQMAALGRGLEGGTPMQAPAQGGPAALFGRAPDGPMALGGSDSLAGGNGNLGGGGVLRPEVSDRMKQFMQTSTGQLASQGVRLTPQQVVSLQQSDMTRLGALERATLGAESRMAQQGLRNEMGGAVRTAKDEAAAAKAEADALKTGKKDSAQMFDETKKLRDEFGAKESAKNFAIVSTAYNLAKDLANNDTAASDMAFVYSVMKAYDPRSTVREGERADASNTGSIPDRIWKEYERARTGKTLLAETRKDFLKTLDDASKRHHENMMRDAKQYESIAKKRGLDFEEVVPPEYMSWTPTASAAPKTAPAAPTGLEAALSKYPPRQGSGPR